MIILLGPGEKCYFFQCFKRHCSRMLLISLLLNILISLMLVLFSDFRRCLAFENV